ncbi:MAG: amidohydrolase [bacterium]|nr:amidohydrolase [bacterium]
MAGLRYFLILSLMLSLLTACSADKADIVLMNGNIYTLEDDQPWASAVAVSGNKIVAVLGGNDDPEQYIGPATKVIDLEGKLAVPGFIDAHVHFAGFSAQQHDIMLMNVDTDDGLAEEVRRVVPLVGEGEWITGGQWSGAIQWEAGKGDISRLDRNTRWEPDRNVIDEFSGNNPCFLSSYDGELYLANTAALRAAGLEDARLEGMKYERGRLTGLIYKGSPAIQMIREAVKPKSEERILNEYRSGLKRLREMGIVEMHDMIHDMKEVDRYLKLQESGELTCRVWIRPWLDLQDEMFEQDNKMGMHPMTGERDYFLRYGGFKSANDGMLGSRGAMLFEPYTDRPDYKGHYQQYNSDSETFGSLVGNPEVYYEFCKKAVENGFCVDSHAIGDRGISEVLDVLERIKEDLDADMSMFRIIHAEIVQPREFERMQALNVIAETNPSQLPDDLRWIRDRIGPEREQLAFPFRGFIDRDIIMNFGSDVPGNAGAIFLNHPKYVLNAAVNRTNYDSEPEGGWLPQHKITMHEALKAHTFYGAYACMREDEVRGSIKVGKLADITIVDRDIMRNDPVDVVNMDILVTIVDGKVVFEKY